MNIDKIQRILNPVIEARNQFEIHVEIVALEIINLAKVVSPAIGDISIDEAKDFMIREFTERLKTPTGKFQR